MNTELPQPRVIIDFYAEEPSGNKPAAKTIRKLKKMNDVEALAAIRKKLYTVNKEGVSGETYLTGGIGKGIREFKFAIGAGIRIYFIEEPGLVGEPGRILVLGVSDKGDQPAEIRKCAKRLKDYEMRTNVKKHSNVTRELRMAAVGILDPHVQRPSSVRDNAHKLRAAL